MNKPMDQEPDLEERLSGSTQNQTNSSMSLTDFFKYFAVYGSANVIFYTPLMTAIELASRMEPEELAKSRGIGAVIGFLTGAAYVMSRKQWARAFGASLGSSELKKTIVDTVTGVAAMLPYALILKYAVGASEEEMYTALALGIAVGAGTGRPYGKFLGVCEKVCGLPPLLDK
ncbi:L-alanine exporter AlaE [Candidatus Woesearchaeota archaeon]|nr:L-alanine exporter AlaE [Candidatus Woesearchaeota archaeon]MBI2581818.1 L-alanine exporter AlaE [Candidatus Woesearchaeota archaeon]